MKIIKKAAAFLLAAVMVSGLTLQAGAAWNYDSNKAVSDKLDSYIEDFGEKWNNVLKCGTRMYYDGSTGEISVLSLARYGDTSHQECNIFYKYKQKTPGSYDFGKEEAYYISSGMATNTDYYNEKGKIISEANFEKFVFEFCDNKNMIEIKLDENMSYFSTDDVDLSSPDYKFIRNITLDTKEKTKENLLPKIDIDSEDMDLKVSWKSSDSSIAEVDSSGNVTAKAVGSCDVTSEIEGVGAVEKYHITVEEYMTEDERAVRNAIKEGGSEKTIYDKIYNIDSYKAAGHVITDVDGDGKYELITRDSSRSVIMIYKISGNSLLEKKFDYPDLGYSNIHMDLRYDYEDKDVYFVATGTDDNINYKVKVFQFVDDEFVLKKTAEYDLTVDKQRVPNDKNNKNIVLSGSWLESFNDDCTEAAPTDRYYISKENSGSYVTAFMDNYLNYKDKDPNTIIRYMSTDNDCYGVPRNKASSLILNEIYARHGMKSSYPRFIAFFNKKSNYKEEHSSGYYDEKVVGSNEFNDFERTAIKSFNQNDNPGGSN